MIFPTHRCFLLYQSHLWFERHNSTLCSNPDAINTTSPVVTLLHSSTPLVPIKSPKVGHNSKGFDGPVPLTIVICMPALLGGSRKLPFKNGVVTVTMLAKSLILVADACDDPSAISVGALI